MVGSVSLAGYSGIVGNTPKASAANGFDSILKSQCNGFEYFKSSVNEYYGESFFHVLDTGKIPLWDRKDFPKELLFKEKCTQKELERICLPVDEPASVSYGDITKTHKMAFVISPAAAEKMKGDPEFCRAVMTKIKTEIPENWYGKLKESTDKNTGSTMTGAGITVEISEDGEVRFNIYGSGQSERSDYEDCTEEIGVSLKKSVGENTNVFVSAADEAVPYEEIKQSAVQDELYFGNAAFGVSDILLKIRRG